MSDTSYENEILDFKIHINTSMQLCSQYEVALSRLFSGRIVSLCSSESYWIAFIHFLLASWVNRLEHTVPLIPTVSASLKSSMHIRSKNKNINSVCCSQQQMTVKQMEKQQNDVLWSCTITCMPQHENHGPITVYLKPLYEVAYKST